MTLDQHLDLPVDLDLAPSATRRLSLLTPSGHLTLGNLLGALRPMAAGQQSATCFYGISDLHALTDAQSAEPAILRSLRIETVRLMLAAGLDPELSTLFAQSQVPAHPRLAYLLECTAHMGELSRMIQYKLKSRGRRDVRVSLFTYPVLMAADILLYDADEVPVGDDQRQHLELTRTVAMRFNSRYGPVFTVPRSATPVHGARVMDLQDPQSKMSKSSQVTAGVIGLLDPPQAVARKVARAVTDSSGTIAYDPVHRPGVSNLLDILAACSGTAPERAAAGIGSYRALKSAVTEAVLGVLLPLQEAYDQIDPDEALRLAAVGSGRAAEVADATLHRALSAVGL